jgi:hypothetical protein
VRVAAEVLHRRPSLGLTALLAVLSCTGCLAAGPAAAAPSLSWSGPVEIDGGHSLRAISCPPGGFCVAVDDAGRAMVGLRPATATAGSWTAFTIDGGRSLSSVSCPSTSLCVAVDGEGRAIVSANPAGGPGSWSAVAIDGATALASVSCASSSLCVAVDGKGNALFSTSPSVAVPGAWSGPVSIATALTSVSCASNALCVAVDGEGHAVLSTEPTGGSSAWHKRLVDPGVGLVAVSCFAAGSCVAFDGSGGAFASSNAAASIGPGAGAGSGATWSSTAVDTLGAPTAVSCAATGLCVAGDGTGYAFASDNPTAAPPAWPATGIDIQPPRALTGTSCVAEGLCAAVDASGRVFTAEVPPPLASTGAASEVAHTTAILAGAVNPNDAALSACRFEYGTSVAYGSSAPCASVPAGGAAEPVSAALGGLTANTTYHYRLLASSASGTSEGADATFKTLAPGLVEPHPSIGGTPAPGQRLTCKSGVASTIAATLGYAWLRDTRAIAGAGGATYAVATADVSHHLQCRVTATTAEGAKSATSAFVTVPAGGLGTISETTVGAPRAGRGAVSVPLRCSAQAAGSCTIRLRLAVQETLRGSRVVAVAAATRRVTVTVGSSTVRLKPGQQSTATVTLNATGRRLLARRRRMPVKLSVSGTVVGAISASLKRATVTLSASGRASARGAGHAAEAAPRARVHARRAVQRRTPHTAGVRARSANAIAATPYMGWDTYFTFGAHFDEASVLAQASQLLTRGLARRGYRYVWLDVGWWQGARDAAGSITVSPTQWPHGLAWLTSTLHANGLKVGLYTDAGAEGCGGPRQGSYGHYQQDVNTFAAWGFDAVKVDFCGGVRQGLEPAGAYVALHEAIAHDTPRRAILLSICDYLQPGQFATEVPALENSAFASYTFGPSSGNSWRTDTDVGVPGDVQFGSVLRNLDADAAQPQAAGPGHWNDPDYLGPDQGMSAAQFRTQFSMWAMLAAPLMVSGNLISLSSASAGTVGNREAIAIDQDPAGLQARLLAASGGAQVWVKPLSDGSRAVALLNRGSSTVRISTTTSAIGMPSAGRYLLRNVWTGAVASLGSPGAIMASVPGGSTVLVRVSAR